MKSKKTIAVTAFGLFLCAAVYGGGSRAGGNAVPKDASADRGSYKRIISVAPSNTDIIIGLGQGDRIIAVDPWSKGIPGVRDELPEIDFFLPDAEAVIGLGPDLILANEVNSQGGADNPFTQLGGVGIKVVQIPMSVSIEGIYSDIRKIAGLLGVHDRGERMVASMQSEIDRIAERAKKAGAKKSVYFEISALPTIVTFGKGAYLNELIEIAGGKNIFADVKGWATISEEQVIRRNPEVILVMAYSGKDSVATIRKRPGFESLAAVKQNRIHSIEGDPASRPSQHIITALNQIAWALYPELFPEFGTDETK